MKAIPLGQLKSGPSDGVVKRCWELNSIYGARDFRRHLANGNVHIKVDPSRFGERPKEMFVHASVEADFIAYLMFLRSQH